MRLSQGLLVVLMVSAVHALFLLLGVTIGDLLRVESPADPLMYAAQNAYIYLGFTLVVLLKMLFPYLRREPQLPVFSLLQWGSVVAMAVATGVNVLLLGIGLGFAESNVNVHKVVWPLFVCSLLLGYLGLMFGRQKTNIRQRRWMVVACVLLLGTAIAAVVNA